MAVQQTSPESKHTAIQEIRVLFKELDEQFSDEDIAKLKAESPRVEPFPTLIFLMALAKDLIDTPTIVADMAGVTGVGLVLTGSARVFSIAFSFITAIVVFVWMWGKVGWGGTRLLKWAWKKWLIAYLAELLLPIVPSVSFMVCLVHRRESKLGRLIFMSIEKIKKGGL